MNKALLRLLDANFNRAREALRVMEDYARFGLNDARLSEQIKTVRHDLAGVMGKLGVNEMLAARDTAGDVGTVLETPAEYRRESVQSVLTAAGKRLGEAMRSLEEYGKIGYPEQARVLESIRYQGYQLEQQVVLRAGRAGRFDRIELYVLVTQEFARRPLMETVRRVLEGGADAIQLREKKLSDSELLDKALSVKELCGQFGALFIMNDRADLAVLAGADGVHLGQGDLPVSQVRHLVGPDMLIGSSTHNLEEAQRAIKENVDYLGVGALFCTPTKPEACSIGMGMISSIRALTALPIVGIGGITPENAGQVIGAGASGVAVCQAVIGQDDPASACRLFKERIKNCRSN